MCSLREASKVAARSLPHRGSGLCLLFLSGLLTCLHCGLLDEVFELMSGAGYEVVQSLTDRRLIVNRSRQLKMFRSVASS